MSAASSSSSAAWSTATFAFLLAALALADQFWFHWTRQDVAAHYGRFGLNPDPNVLTILLTCLFVGACFTFVLVAMLSAAGRRVASRVIIGLGLCTSVAVACLTTFAAEYDGFVLIWLWRFAPWALFVGAAVVAAGEFSGRRRVVTS